MKIDLINVGSTNFRLAWSPFVSATDIFVISIFAFFVDTDVPEMPSSSASSTHACERDVNRPNLCGHLPVVRYLT